MPFIEMPYENCNALHREIRKEEIKKRGDYK